MATAVLIVLAILIATAVALAAASVRVLREYERAVVFRLGRVIDEKGPGLVLLIPAVDRMIRKTATSDQWSHEFHSCQQTIPSAMKGSTVIVPVAIRSAVSFLTGWTSSRVGLGGSTTSWCVVKSFVLLASLASPLPLHERQRAGAGCRAGGPCTSWV